MHNSHSSNFHNLQFIVEPFCSTVTLFQFQMSRVGFFLMLNLFDNIFFVFCSIYKIKDFHMVFVLISFVLLRDRRMESSSKCLFIPISNVQKGLMGFFLMLTYCLFQVDDVFGFNITYELLPSKQQRRDVCTLTLCNFNGQCFLNLNQTTGHVG